LLSLSVGSGLIDEDELAGIKVCLIGFPLQTRLSDVEPILFGGAQRFFEGHSMPFKQAAD
jgi:hypothetical protein